jgi:NADPH:quinone reductase-like Zn-dependent oxidoreductase
VTQPPLRMIAHRFGIPMEVLACEPLGRPPVAYGEVLVRMTATPINPSDLIPVAGAYAARTSLPFVPGYEGTGTIEEVGDNVDPGLIGRRVLPLGSAGCWQTLKVLPADWCILVPDDVDDDEAATAYINPLTALLMVRRMAPQPGDAVGITAAASAIGRILIRMIASTRAHAVAIVRSQSAAESLRCEPAEVVWSDTPMPRLNGAMDAVGGRAGCDLAAAVVPGGQMLHYGLLSGKPLAGTGATTAQYFRLRDIVHAISRAQLDELMSVVFDEIRVGRAAISIAARYPLAEIGLALTHDARVGRSGKILLCP